MKKFLIFTVLSILTSGSVWAEKRTVSFTVNPPLVCNNCENKVKDNLRFEKGVTAVKPSAKEGMVVVTFDDNKTNVDALKEGFKKIGYEASEIQPDENSEKTTPACTSSCCGGGN